MIYQLKRKQELPCNMDEAWEFFATPKNLERLTPSSVSFKITHLSAEEMYEGQMIGYKIKIAPMVTTTWLTEITKVDDARENERLFIDEQRVGPYKVWHHIHHFKDNGDSVTMVDEVTYVLPFGVMGKLAHTLFVKSKLNYIFDQRRKLTEEIFGK